LAANFTELACRQRAAFGLRVAAFLAISLIGWIPAEFDDWSDHQIQEVSNQKNTNEIIHCDCPPKIGRLFGAVYPTMKAGPHFSRTRPNHSRRK
jgi:hypothetical protein